jgi:hypothetical protein
LGWPDDLTRFDAPAARPTPDLTASGRPAGAD